MIKIKLLLTLLLFTFLLSCSSSKSDEFKSIFNGKNLDGWTYKKTKNYKEEKGYIVKNGELITNGRAGNLYTNKRYKNYSLKFQFKFEKGKDNNNGLGLRTEMDGSAPALSSFEVQILDNSSPKYTKLKPYQAHGSVYGQVPAKKGFLKEIGEWNSQEVTINQNQLKVILNGYLITKADLSLLPIKTLPKEGHLCLAGHKDGVSFRNIKIKELP
ncbi:MAG: DUF1080 domain-containing protein [Lentisphaeraceae bacterium]|nr:DUF1080 domain-containing protein [Lentisphaeraceae bacterium]